MPPKRGGGYRSYNGGKFAQKSGRQRGDLPPRRGNNGWASPASHFKQNSEQDAENHGFSMRDEARNTQSHHFDWTCGEASVKLRQKPVMFVSAGFIEPLKEFEPVEDPARDDVYMEQQVRVVEVVKKIKRSEVVGRELTWEEELYVVDDSVEEDAPEEPPTEPLPEPQPEPQSQPLFCFDLVGDKSKANTSLPPPVIPSRRSSAGESDSSEEVILFRGRSTKTGISTESNQNTHPALVTIVAPNTQAPQIDSQPSSKPREKRTKFSRSRSRGGKKAVKGFFEEDEEDADDNEEDEILADYIANMAANPEDDFIARQLGTFNSRRDLGGDNFVFNLGSGDEDDLPVVETLSIEDEDEGSSGLSDAEEDDDDLEDDDNDMDADMDEETLARFLSKGPGGGKNTRPSNGQSSASAVADAFDELDLDGWIQPPRKHSSKMPPDFEMVTSDPDILAKLKTAWSRDRQRKKDKKLEREQLRAQGLLGKNSASSPDDLRVKYPLGLKLDDFKTELALFLVGSAAELEFPPLDKHARLILHKLAHQFQVKSQSKGKGDTRRPVLYRTNRTITFKSHQLAEATRRVDAIAINVKRKYFHRADVKPPKGGGCWENETSTARVSMKALILREGEVVGASAPELGQENKGRAMLEKMGWSKGMGLGAVENKGILEPVAQVVKKSKAGLGRTHTGW
ncbi:hypothetical protein QBC38DRAFT_473083 [Podospora fimiseda]|uniref:Protein SQS1 n=1 Tax=Podospora fimiseda TaxID=252190 RepID=A0AAN7H1M8_9PEZI|nr:hypothetical protein QBC38DRAFT_473083 [Podospora fimiseda]